MANAPWNPLGLSEVLDPTLPVPLGYTNTLGTMDLLDLDLEWENIAPTQTGKEIPQEQVADELTEASTSLSVPKLTSLSTRLPQKRMSTRSISLFWVGSLWNKLGVPLRLLPSLQQSVLAPLFADITSLDFLPLTSQG